MNAMTQETEYETPGESQALQSSEEIKESLIEQLTERREGHTEDAGQEETKQNSSQGDVGEEDFGEGHEEQEATHQNEEEGKKFTFSLGENEVDVDENAELEFKADGKTVRMSLKQMRDSAAGGVAVRNRMRQLAEEKKKVFTPFQDFSKLSSKDPLTALKKVFKAIESVDENADFDKFLVGLGKQAQSLTQMSDSERKAYELERELDETRETLSETDRLAKIRGLQQELVTERNMTEDQIYRFSNSILENPALAKDIKSEEDLFDRVGDLADEVERQQAVKEALHKFDKRIANDDPLVFELSRILSNNPDFTETDLEEIAEGVLSGVKKSKASMNLSRKQRRSNAVKGKSNRNIDPSRLPPKDSLKAQILEKKKSQQKY